MNNLQNSNLFRQPNIPSWEQVFMFFTQSGGTEEMAKRFFDKWSAVGWFCNGSPIINFAPLANSFIANWNANKTKKTGKERWLS